MALDPNPGTYAGQAGTRATKVRDPNKPKRVVKKRPLVIVYKGDNVEVLHATRDMEIVVDALQADPTAKIKKVAL